MSYYIVQGIFRGTVTQPNGAVNNLNTDQAVTNIFLESRDVALSGDDKLTFLDGIVPKIKNMVGATTLELVIKGRDRLEDTLETLITLDLADNTLPEFFTIKSCVYYRFRLQASAVPIRWNLFGVELWGEPDGDYL